MTPPLPKTLPFRGNISWSGREVSEIPTRWWLLLPLRLPLLLLLWLPLLPLRSLCGCCCCYCCCCCCCVHLAVEAAAGSINGTTLGLTYPRTTPGSTEWIIVNTPAPRSVIERLVDTRHGVASSMLRSISLSLVTTHTTAWVRRWRTTVRDEQSRPVHVSVAPSKGG